MSSNYHFPLLNVNQIILSVSELCSLQIDESMFKKPDPVQWQEVFRRMLCEIKGMPEDACLQPLVLLEAEIPEAHNTSVPLMNIIVIMQKIMPIIGVADFSGGDVLSPKAERLKKICSAVINFLRFKHSRIFVYDDIKKQMEQDREHHDTVKKRGMELRQKIDKIRSERAKHEPELLKIQEEIEIRTTKMAEHQKNKLTLRKNTTEIKTRISEKKAEADHLKCAILKAKEEGDKLSSKIVQSPDKVRAEQENLQHQLIELRESLERKRSRLSQLQKLRENFKQYLQNVEKGLKICEFVKNNIDKESLIAEQIIQIHDKIQEVNQQTQDQYNKKTLLQSQLTMRQEKLAKLSLQHQSRMKVLHEQFESLQEEKEMCLKKQNSDSERRLELVELKRRAEEEVKKEQLIVDQRVEVLMNMYGTLIEKTDKSHSDMAKNWDEVRQLLKQC